MANNLFTILYSKTQCLHHLSSHPHDTLSNQAFISLFHQKPCLYRTTATSILSNLIRSQFSFYFARLQCLTQSITSTFLKLCSSLGFGIPHYFNLPSFIYFFSSVFLIGFSFGPLNVLQIVELYRAQSLDLSGLLKCME